MKKQLTIICIVGMLLVVGLSGCLENNKENNGNIINPLSGQVTVTTNKSEYNQNETINITLYNGLNVSIFSRTAGIPNTLFIDSIEEKTIDGWQSFLTYLPVSFALFFGEIKSGESVSFDWKPSIWIGGWNLSQLEPGIYRIPISYNLSENNTSQTVYSNEFTIKEEDTPYETFTVYRESQKLYNFTVYNVSIPLDESEAITTIFGEDWSGPQEGYFFNITKTDNGWDILYGPVVAETGYVIDEQNRTITIHPGL